MLHPMIATFVNNRELVLHFFPEELHVQLVMLGRVAGFKQYHRITVLNYTIPVRNKWGTH